MKGKDIDQLPPQEVLQMVTSYLDERFGITASMLSEFGLYLASKGRVYLGPKRIIEKPKVVTLGLIIARVSRSVKPSTNLLQFFGRQIQKNCVDLTKEQTVAYVKGEDLRLSSESLCSPGYVLIKYQGIPLGCGFLQNKIIKNLLPKAKRMGLKFV